MILDQFSAWMSANRTLSDNSIYKYTRAINTISNAEAVKELLRCSGTQFDEMVVKIFIERVLPDMTLI